MRPCCHFTRRQLLQWSAVVAATPVVASSLDVERAYGLTRSVKSNATALPINLELVTLTETSAILTWFTGDPTRPDRFGRLAPMPANTELQLGTATGKLRTIYSSGKQTPYHYVEVRGLEPGETYRVVAKSNGLIATPSTAVTGGPIGTSALAPRSTPLLFTTPQPPPGRHLFTIALCADLHLGEKTAGLLTTAGGVQIPPGIQQEAGKRPYAEITADALSRETRERGADLLLAAGDVTSEAAQKDTRNAKHYLDQFGTYKQDYFVARGNHDRAHTTKDAAACSTSTLDGGHHDCFHDSFAPDEKTYFVRERFGLRILGLDTYDKLGNGGDKGYLGAGQLAFVGHELSRDRDRPTIVFGHHPLALDGTTNTLPPLNGLNAAHARQLTTMYKYAPGVFFHLAGHIHRNKRAQSLAVPRVQFQEVSATKEYPGGFSLLRIHEGGYAMNFYKLRDLAAQEWVERSRPEYLGAAPIYTLGNVADRNYMVKRDLSGLKKA